MRAIRSAVLVLLAWQLAAQTPPPAEIIALQADAEGNIGLGTDKPSGRFEVIGTSSRMKIGGAGGDAHHLTTDEFFVFNSRRGGMHFRGASYDNVSRFVSLATLRVPDTGTGGVMTFQGTSGGDVAVIGRYRENFHGGIVGVRDEESRGWAAQMLVFEKNEPGEKRNLRAAVKGDVVIAEEWITKSASQSFAAVVAPSQTILLHGSAQLVNGAATVELPPLAGDTYSLPTIHLTPGSAECKGLAVVEKSTERFVVRELAHGNGTYPFDYTAAFQKKDDNAATRGRLLEIVEAASREGISTDAPARPPTTPPSSAH